MKNVFLNMCLCCAVLLSVMGLLFAPAFAADFSGGVNLTSNYVYRGVSYSDNKAAIQGFVKSTGDNGFGVGVGLTSWHDQVDDSRVIISPFVSYTQKSGRFTTEWKVIYRNYFGEPSIDWVEGIVKTTFGLGSGFSTWAELASSPSYMRDDGLMYNATYGIDYHYKGLMVGGHYGYKDVSGDEFTGGHINRYWSGYIAHGIHENALVELRYTNTNVSAEYPYDLADEHYVASLKFGF